MSAAEPPIPRLVATDLDGTLLRPDGTVSSRTRAVLRAMDEAGVLVVFATARPPRWLEGLRDEVGAHGTAICANGAVVYDVRARRVLAERVMPAGLVAELVGDLRSALPTASFAVERRDGLGLETRWSSTHPVPRGAPVVPRIEAVLTDATYKLLAQCAALAPDRLLFEVAAVIDGRAVLADSGALGLAEISGPGVTKAATLAAWASSRGIVPSEVWAFGDAPNDLDMLRWAGVSFAVANAHPAARAAADRTCDANDRDGVAAELEAMLERLAARD